MKNIPAINPNIRALMPARRFLTVVPALLLSMTAAEAQTSAFTYQGRLTWNSTAVSVAY